MTDRHPLWLRAGLTAYRLSCRLLPRSFRDRFGAEAEGTLQDLLEDTRRTHGSRAAMTTAAAACGDVARVGVSERATAWHSAVAAGITSDLGQAVRIYRRQPGLAAALALTLALVAGPAVAIFSLLYHVVLAPLPYPDADRLVVLGHQTRHGIFHYLPVASVSDYRAVQAFSMVGGMFPVGSNIGADGEAVRVQASRVTAGLLTILGVPFAAGRDLERGEHAIVVTRGLALARFGSDAAVVGQTVIFNRKPTPIVGVLAYSPPLPATRAIEVFSPHVSADQAVPSRKQGGQAIVIARLRPDSTRTAALAQARIVASAVRRDFGGPEATIDLVTLRTAVSGSMRVPLLILFATVLVVFLIAVTSLASLVLARAASRASDVAVRRSLGASGWRLVRSWLVEGAVLAVPGTVLGVWVGNLLLGYTRATLPSGILPLPDSMEIGPIVVGVIALAFVSAGLFAMAPLAAGLLRTSASWRDGAGSTAGLRRVRAQSVLIVVQVALSLVLVASAVWLSTSLWRMFSRPIGFDPTNLVAMQTQSTQLNAVQIQTARLMLERLRPLDSNPASGVAVSSSLSGVNAGRYGPRRIRAGDPEFTDEDQPSLARSAVSTDYFRVLGIRLLEGRTFTAADEANPERVIVVSRSFAARWLPDDALGQVLTFNRDDRREVIGVVEDVHTGRLSQDRIPQFYTPMNDGIAPSTYVFRTPLAVETIRREATTLLRELDPTATLAVRSLAEAMAMPLVLEITANRLTIALAALALLLAVVNVYALSAFAVVQRTREIGIRIALGARAGDAMRLVMRRGLVWVSVGMALGAAGVIFLAAPLIERQLFETRTSDPVLLALAFAIVAGVAILASWLPARRAASIDPAVTLRAE
jgi:putative ABC transport system permease protein